MLPLGLGMESLRLMKDMLRQTENFTAIANTPGSCCNFADWLELEERYEGGAQRIACVLTNNDGASVLLNTV